MSWPALKWALKKRVPASQKSALITLARRQPDDLRPFARPMATLAKETGLSVGGFKLVIAALVGKGLLVIKSTGNRPCTYELQLSSANHDVASKLLASKPVASNPVYDRSAVGDQPASHSVTTKKHNKQTPKDKHSSSRSREKQKADPRFGEFVTALETYWRNANPDLAFDFTPKDGKALNTLLKSRPTLDLKTFASWLNNRFNSEDVNHGDEFYAWLPRIAKYAAGPLNRYQQPLTQGVLNGDRSSQPSSTFNKGQVRTDAQKDAARGAYQALLGGTGADGHL